MSVTYHSDVWREIQAIEAFRARRDRIQAEANAWTLDKAHRLTQAARVFPWLEPGVTRSLVDAGFNPDDPVFQYAATESALQRGEQLGGWQPVGATVQQPDRTRSRQQAALRTGQRLGLFDEDGVLVEPEDRDSREHRAFENIVETFDATEEDLPYLNARGEAVMQAGEGADRETRSLTPEPSDDRSTIERGFGAAFGGITSAGAALQRAVGIDEGLVQAGESVGRGAAEDPMKVLRDFSRTAFMALDAPVQELQGQFRNAVQGGPGFVSPQELARRSQSQSDLGIAIESVVTGEGPVDVGEGFFVNQESPVAQERLRRERQRGDIDGHVITLGRWAADSITEPGTKPYQLLSGLVDAGVQVADPGAAALGVTSKAARAASMFQPDEVLQAAGGFNGLRRFVHGPTATAWLNGPVGTKVAEVLAADASPASIWRRLNRKVDPADAARLADATTTDEVSDILRPLLGTTFRSTTELATVRKVASPGVQRWRAQMPGPYVDPYDLGQSMDQTERWLVNAKVDAGVTTNILDDLARTKTRAGIFDVVERAMAATDGVLAANGIDSAPLRSRLTRMFSDTHKDAQHWFVDEAGNDVDLWSNVVVNSDEISAPGPHLPIELLDRVIPLPDARAVRRLTSRYKHIFAKGTFGFEQAGRKTGQLRAPLAFLDFMQGEIWKPFVLLRVAWPIRVIGEEQARMAAAQRDALFNHPVSYIAWVMGRKGGTDLFGDALAEAEQYRRAMTRGSAGWLLREPGRVRTAVPTVYRKTVHEQDEFLESWAGELAMLHADPVVSKVARSETLDEVAEWFYDGAGQKFRKELIDAGHPELAQREVSRRYLENVVGEYLRVKTGGNADLLDVVRTGKLKGADVFDADGIRIALTPKALEPYLDAAPDAVKGRHIVSIDPSLGEQVLNGWRHATDYMFGGLMSYPTNKLSRSPTFRQAYWARAEELVGFADEATKTKMLAAAADAGMGSRRIRRMSRIRAQGELNLDEVDALAKGYALDETKKLLYDLSERSQFMDAMRVVFPFGEAWKEVVTRWFGPQGLLAQNPRMIRRGQQVIEGARGEDFGEVMGAPDGEGFFFTNEFGEEVFVYPGSEFLTRETMGVPVPLTGRVEGLNLMTSIMPGLGPVAQIPASAFLPDKPGWRREWRELLMPFGSPADEGDQGGWFNLLNYGPAWMKKGVQALVDGGVDENSDRLWNNTVMDVARYLMSTGRYDPSTPAGISELLEDARGEARKFYGIRSLAQFVAPSAPTPEWLMEADGELVRTAILTEEYERLFTDDPSTAAETFLARYGEDVMRAVQPKSRTVIPGLEATTEARDWMEANPDVVRDLPNTWAFFAPRGGEFDYDVYIAQLRQDHRQALTPKQWLRLGNDRLGDMIYSRAQDALPPNPSEEQRAWLRDVKAAIVEEYAGYGDPTGLIERTPPDVFIRELAKAADTPEVARTDAGKALALYLRGRNSAIQEAEARGLVSFTKAQSTRDLRDWLRDLANQITRKYPEFDPLWTALEREMNDDTEVER